MTKSNIECETCGLASEGENHKHLSDCVKALRIAMVKQRQSAERIGLDMSIHFLRALEELAIRPDVGFRYTVWNPEKGEQQELPPQQVSGVFASILRVYREQSNFKPDEEQRSIASHWSWVAGKLAGSLQLILGKYDIDEHDASEASILLEQISDGSIERPKES